MLDFHTRFYMDDDSIDRIYIVFELLRDDIKGTVSFSRIFSFFFFLAFFQTSYGFILVKTYKLHYFYLPLYSETTNRGESLSLQRFYPAAIFAFSHASNILFTK